MRNIEVLPGSKWKHFKGFIIEVILLARHTETNEDLVVYTHNNTIWARPLSMFLSEEDISLRPDNITKQKYRFERID